MKYLELFLILACTCLSGSVDHKIKWNPDNQYLSATHRNVSYRGGFVWPGILMAIFVELPTPFLEEQLNKLWALDYPKNKIHLFLHNNVQYHAAYVQAFIKKMAKVCGSVKEIPPSDNISEHTILDVALDYWIDSKCEYFFAVSSTAHLDNPQTLKLLLEENKTVVTPVLVFRDKTHYYIPEYYKGHASRCYLISRTVLKKYESNISSYRMDDLDEDMDNIHISNASYFGHYVFASNFNISLPSPEMYECFTNPIDWEERYISQNYFDNFNPENKPLQPCCGVYWFPIVTPTFCKELIHMAESLGEWGTFGSYKNVYNAHPTVDIFIFQINWTEHVSYFIEEYVIPLRKISFDGYIANPAVHPQTFIARFRTYEQPYLYSHADSSTYTINLALNQRGVDYEGGGCRFFLHNCSVIDTKPGWILMHDGALKHEGLPTTKGTRYVLVSFIDPSLSAEEVSYINSVIKSRYPQENVSSISDIG